MYPVCSAGPVSTMTVDVIYFQGELLCILNSLSYVQRSKLYTVELPNAANMSFSYYYYLIFIMLSYIPGELMFYSQFHPFCGYLCGLVGHSGDT